MRDDLLGIMESLSPKFDVIILDTGAGISDVVLFAVSLASEVLLVATPEPTSLTDANATIKVLVAQQDRRTIRTIINQTARMGDGRTITLQLQQVLDRFVQNKPGQQVRLVHVGDIPSDPEVRQAVMRRQLLMQSTPGCPAGLALTHIAVKLEETVISKLG